MQHASLFLSLAPKAPLPGKARTVAPIGPFCFAGHWHALCLASPQVGRNWIPPRIRQPGRPPRDGGGGLTRSARNEARLRKSMPTFKQIVRSTTSYHALHQLRAFCPPWRIVRRRGSFDFVGVQDNSGYRGQTLIFSDWWCSEGF